MLTDAADFPESFKITLGEKFLCYDSRSHFPVGLLSCHTIEPGDSEELWEMLLRRHVFYMARCFFKNSELWYRIVNKTVIVYHPNKSKFNCHLKI